MVLKGHSQLIHTSVRILTFYYYQRHLSKQYMKPIRGKYGFLWFLTLSLPLGTKTSLCRVSFISHISSAHNSMAEKLSRKMQL